MLIKKCIKCNTYTLKEICPKCGGKTKSAHPPKFSLEKEKKYWKYKI
ncbi:MAG: nucleolar RNA-binding Nop10p family protein [Candidatus Aenigmarchaeota archaeon]|nr:nucleolar RNA-binding Nop10p family protein [Candidatus Aenigmarchaeota archaeon]